MYKWGFFILLAVNVFLYGRKIISHANISDGLIANHRETETDDKSVKAQKTKSFPSLTKPPKYTLNKEISPKNDLEENIKENILNTFIFDVKNQYTYFYTFNKLPQEKFKAVELILAEKQSRIYDCFGEASSEEVLLKKFTDAGLNFREAYEVLNFLEKQWTYNELKNMRADLLDEEDLFALVDELHDLHKEQMKEYLSELETDPFAEDDLDIDEDSEVFEEEELLEDEISEFEEEVVTIDQINKFKESLSEKRLEQYENKIYLLERFIPLDNRMKLEIIFDFIH